MKAVTTKEFISLAGIAIVTPVFAMSILVSARTSGVAESEVTLFLMALCGAVVSGLNGFGRRSTKAELRTPRASKDSPSKVATHS